VSGGAAELATRARAWRDAMHAAICDVAEPWEHGTIVRSTRYPRYYDLNLVRVEDAGPLRVEEACAVADRALAGLEHRRLTFDCIALGEQLRAGFLAAGFSAMRLLWLRHAATLPSSAGADVRQVPYDAVHELRAAWNREDSPERDDAEFQRFAREVALARGAVVLGVHDDAGELVGFAQVEFGARAAEVAQVYVRADRRGAGLGAAVTAAAVRAAGAVEDVWITADDADRAKHLYLRLGFRPAWTTLEVQRLSGSARKVDRERASGWRRPARMQEASRPARPAATEDAAGRAADAAAGTFRHLVGLLGRLTGKWRVAGVGRQGRRERASPVERFEKAH